MTDICGYSDYHIRLYKLSAKYIEGLWACSKTPLHQVMKYSVALSIMKVRDLSNWREKQKSQLGCALQWSYNGHDSVSNHQPHDCLLNRLFRRRSNKISKLRVTGLCAWNSPETGEFPAQMASNAENVSIWWRLHGNATIPFWTRLMYHDWKDFFPRLYIASKTFCSSC